MNIDAARIALSAQDCPSEGRAHGRRITASERGRWPANLLLSHGAACTGRALRAGLPDRAARGPPPLLLRREGHPTRARGRLRGATPTGHADVQDRRPQRGALRGEPRREHPPDGQADRADALARPTPNAAGRTRARPVHRLRQHRRRRRARGRTVPRDRARSDYLPIARARIKYWSSSRRGCASANARARQKAKA